MGEFRLEVGFTVKSHGFHERLCLVAVDCQKYNVCGDPVVFVDLKNIANLEVLPGSPVQAQVVASHGNAIGEDIFGIGKGRGRSIGGFFWVHRYGLSHDGVDGLGVKRGQIGVFTDNLGHLGVLLLIVRVTFPVVKTLSGDRYGHEDHERNDGGELARGGPRRDHLHDGDNHEVAVGELGELRPELFWKERVDVVFG